MNSKALAIILVTVALAFMGLGFAITEPVFAYYGGYHGFGYHRGFGYHGFGYPSGFPGGFGFHGIHIMNQANNCDRSTCLNDRKVMIQSDLETYLLFL